MPPCTVESSDPDEFSPPPPQPAMVSTVAKKPTMRTKPRFSLRSDIRKYFYPDRVETIINLCLLKRQALIGCLAVVWDVSRLGRSLKNLVELLEEFHTKDVNLYFYQQGIDTTTPSGENDVSDVRSVCRI